MKKNKQLKQRLEWQQLLSLHRVTGKNGLTARTTSNSQDSQESAATGCLTEQAEKFPKEAASLTKTNISQAHAGFGKLLIRKKLHESFCFILINQNTQFQQVKHFISAIVLTHLHTVRFNTQEL